MRPLPALLAPGGHALLCLNAPELAMAFLHGLVLVLVHAAGLAFVEPEANPAVLKDVDGRA